MSVGEWALRYFPRSYAVSFPRVGDRVRLSVCLGRKCWEDVSGDVIDVNDRHFTVRRDEGYAESFAFVDFHIGLARLKAIREMGGLADVGKKATA